MYFPEIEFVNFIKEKSKIKSRYFLKNYVLVFKKALYSREKENIQFMV